MLSFLGVARFQDRAIVASHAYNTVIDLTGVKEVLKSDQLSVRPGVHFSFASGGSSWHLMSDVEGRIFILISERTYPVRAAHACLEEFQRSVSMSGGGYVCLDRSKPVIASDHLRRNIYSGLSCSCRRARDLSRLTSTLCTHTVFGQDGDEESRSERKRSG